MGVGPVMVIARGDFAAPAQAAVQGCWITVNSGAPGKQGHMSADEANTLMASKGAAYSAYVIDAEGVLRYNGAIDSISSGDQADIPKATQYVTQALAEIKAGKPVSVPTTQPYGCSVKYL